MFLHFFNLRKPLNLTIHNLVELIPTKEVKIYRIVAKDSHELLLDSQDQAKDRGGLVEMVVG
jgi:hypothetical protein